jgi:hypothetical protein
MQNGRLKFKNAANIVCKILQIPCNMKEGLSSIWQNARQILLFVSLFFGFDRFPNFPSSLFCKALRASWLHQQQPQQQQQQLTIETTTKN